MPTAPLIGLGVFVGGMFAGNGETAEKRKKAKQEREEQQSGS